jgi:hypothetical protein
MQGTEHILERFTPPASGIAQDLGQPIARWVSFLSSPPLLGLAGMLLLGLALDNTQAWGWLMFYAASSVAAPVLYILWLMRRGEVGDFHMQARTERLKPLGIILVFSLLSLLVFHLGHASLLFQALGTSGILQAATLLVVTRWWKISGHSAGAASFSVLLWGLYGAAAAPAMLFVPLVMWARIRRGRHDLPQTVGGALVGASCMLLALAMLAPVCPGAGFLCV